MARSLYIKNHKVGVAVVCTCVNKRLINHDASAQKRDSRCGGGVVHVPALSCTYVDCGMSGATLSIRAHREFAGHVGFRTDNWSLELRLQSSESSDIRPGPARLLVRLRNFYDRPVFDVHDVSRVQFVPTAHDAHKFNLRLFRLLESEGEGAEDLVTGVRDSPIGELLLTFSRPRPNLLVFEEQDVLASRASWRTDVGWQLLRYATGSFFWQASADPSRHEQFLTPQPAEPPAEQDYDISELLAAAQLTDTEDADKINEWRCAICHDGVAGGRQLASAHAPGLANGKLHVFHRQCLEEWRVTPRSARHARLS